MKREKLKEAITEALLDEAVWTGGKDYINPEVGDVFEGSFRERKIGLEPFEAMLVVKVLNKNEFLGQIVYTKYDCEVPEGNWDKQKQCFAQKPYKCNMQEVDGWLERQSKWMKKDIRQAGGNVEKAIANNNRISTTYW